MSSDKLVLYYQTFSNLNRLINLNQKNIYIYVSSLHFGTNPNGSFYIHLNDSSPYIQKDLWDDLKKASDAGINILLMLGGAGGAYTTLFQDYEICYQLLKDLIKKYPFIKGIDLDVEEYVSLENIKHLILDLKNDFGDDFIITLAPVQYSLETDSPGMGGFIYKDLYLSEVGKYINWFNVQAYNDYSYAGFSTIVKNGYPSEKIVFGMLGDNVENFNIYLQEIKKIKDNYSNVSGIMMWEYGDTAINPITWVEKINPLLVTKNSQTIYDYLLSFF